MALNVAAVQKYAFPAIQKAMLNKESTEMPYLDSWEFDVSLMDIPYCCTTAEMPSTTSYQVIALSVCCALQNCYYALMCNCTNLKVKRILKFFGFEERYSYFGGHGATVYCMVLLLRGYKL